MVNLTLTDQGLDQFEEVLLAVFQYIYMLQAKGVQKQYFDEMKTIEETKFRFKEKVLVLSTINHHWKPAVGVCSPTIEIKPCRLRVGFQQWNFKESCNFYVYM